MATKNDITGDTLKTKPASEKYRENWDRIFGNKTPQQEKPSESKDIQSDQAMH